MALDQQRLLECVGSTEETTFGELCKALGDDCPSERGEWASLFRLIHDAEREQLIEVEWHSRVAQR